MSKWIKRKEAAVLLGVSVWKFDRTARLSIPNYKLGGTLRFKSDDVIGWLKARKDVMQ